MELKDFDVSKYVEKKKKGVREDVKESFRKQVPNLLKKFNLSGEYDFWTFDRTHVLSYFPINKYNEDEIEKFLDHLFNLKYTENSKIISNMNKIDINGNFNSISMSRKNFEYDKSLEYKKQKNRQIIREKTHKINFLVDNLKKEMEKANINNLGEILDYVSDIILQTLNYWIITFSDISKSKKESSLNEINCFLENYKKKLWKSEVFRHEKMDLKEASYIFSVFLKYRNSIGDYINIQKVLSKEITENLEIFGDVEDCFRVEKRELYDEKKGRIKILENKDEYCFDVKLDEAIKIIEIFEKYGGRKIKKDSVMDLKVHFREIFISKSIYKGNQALRIVRDYLEKGEIEFEKKIEEIFLREKITRGYFREGLLTNLYIRKNTTTRLVYDILLAILLFYNVDKSLEFFKDFTIKMIDRNSIYLKNI